MFRGREVTHPERGRMILDRLAEELAELAIIEQRPNLDGRNMTMMLGPSKAVLAGTIDGGTAPPAEAEAEAPENGESEAATAPTEAAAAEVTEEEAPVEAAPAAADDEAPAAS
jgi:translation initiation factor IF-3